MGIGVTGQKGKREETGKEEWKSDGRRESIRQEIYGISFLSAV